jgi:peptidoglycan/LPS O-acetylase OafA/YrhL
MGGIIAAMRDINSSTHPSYRPDIDGLRAIAVLSVVIHHAFPTGILTGGFIGVDIFFVISGYLISTILIGDLENGRFSFLVFYSRRILRIFPALIVVLAFCLLFGWLALFPDEYKQIGKHIVGGSAFVANLVLWSEVGYFDNSAQLKPLLHLWSLGIEEQFYIVWPMLLLVAWRTDLGFVRAAFILCMASFGIGLYSTYADTTEAFYSPLGRLWELLAGGGLAYMVVHDRNIFVRYERLKAALGILLLAVGLLTINANSTFPGFWALLPVVGALLLISAGPDAWVNRVMLSNRLMVFFGLISYPLYLWHWPLLAFLRIGNADGTYRDVPVLSRLIAVFLAIFLSWGVYKVVERPIRFGNHKRIWTKALAGSMITVGLFGCAVFARQGVPSRIRLTPPSASVLFDDYPHFPLKNEACEREYPELQSAWSCLLSKPRKAELAIIGDSHAEQYYRSLANNLSASAVLNFSQPICLPFSSRPGCQGKVEELIKFIKDNESIRTIILTGYFSFLASDFKYGNVEGARVANDLSATDKKAYQASADRLLSALTALNRNIIVLRDIPDLVFKPRYCVSFQNPVMALLRGSVNSKTTKQCGIAVDAFERRMKDHDDALLEVLARYPAIDVFDPRPLFCDTKMCIAFRDGHFLYWNSDHLTLEGADLVIARLLATTHINNSAVR